jgi:hypothetical protein
MSWKSNLNRREFLRRNVPTLAALDFAGGLAHAETPPLAATNAPIPDKTVVLPLDDAVKSHRTFVAPLLKELGFRATFFVTHRWMGEHQTDFFPGGVMAALRPLQGLILLFPQRQYNVSGLKTPFSIREKRLWNR